MRSRRFMLKSAAQLLAAMASCDLEFCRRASAASSDDASVEEFLEETRRKYDLPALAFSVIKDGDIREPHAVGFRKYGASKKVTVDDQFHLGSDTKAMTATLIGMLIEAGELDWSSRLDKLFPEFANSMHEGFKSVTIDMLLAARGGLPSRAEPLNMANKDLYKIPGSAREQRYSYIKMMLSEPPDYRPGSMFVYSNTGYALLGVIAEQLTDSPWETLMHERIFQPLGMDSAGFGAMGTRGLLDQPLQHMRRLGKIVPVVPGKEYSDNPEAIAPGGLVHCSVGDWAKFVRVHVLEGKGGGPHLLSEATLRKLHTPLFGGDYVAGWAVTTRTWAHGKTLTHTGSNRMNFAVAWLAPAIEFAVMVCTNFGDLDIAPKACDDVCAEQIRRLLPG